MKRRSLLQAATATTLAAPLWTPFAPWVAAAPVPSVLPLGPTPEPLTLPHFASPVMALVWRNWGLVPVDRLAAVLGADPAVVAAFGQSMGLPAPAPVPEDQWKRSFITILKRNWHLLPYDQLLALLDWTPEKLAFTLREDDFLFIKLGSLKPACPPVRWTGPTPAETARAAAIAAVVHEEFPDTPLLGREPLFQFVRDLSAPVAPASTAPRSEAPRFCYSYFALYGDPLLEPDLDPYPEALLARLAASGVTGVWLQGVLSKLAPFPWDDTVSLHHSTRRKNLHALTERAARHGIRIYLYLNEPRMMPRPFFAGRPELKGVDQGDHAALCTSAPAIRSWITDAVAAICRDAPEIGGFFTITASENPTHCWSHGRGADCPRCGPKGPAHVTADVSTLIRAGVDAAASPARVIAWDWAWADAWALEAIEKLPAGVALMSVSEWSTPIERGGVKSEVGEYSLSVLGPGPRAKRHWAAARRRGLPVFAKIQAANTWELSSVPYIPAVAQTFEHATRLRAEGLDGVMLGWTLGGYPSPNLDAVATAMEGGSLQDVARRRHGDAVADATVTAWQALSAALDDFPYHIESVYNAPFQLGPANLLWARPTGYASTMVCFPYDDLTRWRAVYPADVWAGQLEKVAAGFEAAVHQWRAAVPDPAPGLAREMAVAEACGLYWGSAARQARFITARDTQAPRETMLPLIESERLAARRLHALQSADSRLGFEASNHYFHTPLDLVEKVLNTRWIADQTP
jgi:hypothetical protein